MAMADASLEYQLLGAVRESDMTEVRSLLSNGASINQRSYTSTGRLRTIPLHCACIVGNVHVVQGLLDLNADINSTDTNKDTPLIWASYMGHSRLVELLIARGANVEAIGWGNICAIRVARNRGHLHVSDKIQQLHYDHIWHALEEALRNLNILLHMKKSILGYWRHEWMYNMYTI